MNDIEEKLRAISLRLRTESRRDDIPLCLGDTCEASADELLTLAGQVGELYRELASAETLRPQWAQGFTSDSVAAQVQSVALAQLWTILGAEDQTSAVKALRALTTITPDGDLRTATGRDLDALAGALLRVNRSDEALRADCYRILEGAGCPSYPFFARSAE